MTAELSTEKKGLTQSQMKYIVIILMTLDHIVHFLPKEHVLYLPFRIISRLTAPTLAFFIAEGYVHTHDIKAYIRRMFLFSIISAVPYTFFDSKQLLPVRLLDGNAASEGAHIYLDFLDKTLVVYCTGVIFTLFLGLLCIYIWDRKKLPVVVKILLTLVIIWLSAFGDWRYWDILYCLCFYFLRKNKAGKWGVYVLISLTYIFGVRLLTNPFAPELVTEFHLYRLGTLLVPVFLILLYNGKPGRKTALNKWFFYLYYPVHLLVITLVAKPLGAW